MAADLVVAKLTEMVEEALELRHGEASDPEGRVSLPAYELGYGAAIDMLQRVRVRLDRVEELQSKARRVKAQILRDKDAADFDAALAYDQAMAHQRATRSQEYVSAAEKNADAALASLEQKRAAHQMKRRESFASEALDVITDCYWGLNRLREDILEMTKLHSFTTSVEVQT